MQISVQMQGAKELTRALAMAETKLGNLGPVMRTIADQQFKSTMQNFRSESFAGESWPKLAESTAQRFVTGTPGQQRKKKRGKGMTKRKGKRRGHAHMLVNTGQLKGKIHQSHSKLEARVESGTPWAFVHNFGAPMKHFQMPQRQFMGITPEDEADHMKAINFFIDREVFSGIH